MNLSFLSLSDNKSKHNEILKMLAIVFMVIDHIGAILYPENLTFRMIGRVAFPIFAYQLAQGYTYTSNYSKYMFRLWLFALISQVPYSIAFDTFNLNIMFTFVLSLFLIDKIHKKEYYWIFTILAIPFFIHVDYGMYGILLPVAFYLTRNKGFLNFLVPSIITLLYLWHLNNPIVAFAILGIIVALYFPRQEIKIKMNKYFFYWFYPVHIIILFLIKII